MYIMDTDICIFWLKGNRKVARRIGEHGIDGVGVTIITACELYFGAHNSQKREANIATLDELFTWLRVVEMTFETAKTFGNIKASLRKEGKTINDADLLIASIVIANDGTLITNNTSHFERIPGLRLENWLL